MVATRDSKLKILDSKQERLNEIKEQILRDKVCSELAAGATQLVFSDGSPEAEIVFIGEAPGKNEDEQGLPFVGAAGKFLDEMLASIEIKREDVYITNIVKYRPPNNRDPLPEEKAAFLPFLKAQLEVIQPKLIVTLGRHSMENLLPSLKISECHGQPKRIKVRLSDDSGADTMQSAATEDTSHELEDQNTGDSGASALQGTATEDTSHELGASTRKKRSAQQTVQMVQSASTTASDAVMAQESDQHVELGSAAGSIVSWVVLPLFHPAAALYNGSMRQTLIDDFAKIPKILAKIN